MQSKPQSALVVVGHGSTLNPDSSAPTYAHVDEIGKRGVFAEVVATFWKEEPGMRDVYHMLDSKEVYVVPDFISEGYFTQEVIPRELRLAQGERIGTVFGKTVKYCDPVGIHPAMTGLLEKRAREVAPGVKFSETALVIVGHGTGLNENSTKAIKDQVAWLKRSEFGFREVVDAYMEEAPLISDWQKLTDAPNVVVVPFFISDGLHSYQDIPVMLGLEKEPTEAASQREVFRRNPNIFGDRKLYYSAAIGTDPMLADVILDQVVSFDQTYGVVAAAAH